MVNESNGLKNRVSDGSEDGNRASPCAGQHCKRQNKYTHTRTQTSTNTTNRTNVETGFVVQLGPSDFNVIHDKSCTVAAAAPL